MAKQLQSIAIQAPGFYGLNTQDSPTALPEQFALVAENCVIDQFGRVGARKGWAYETTTNGDALVHINEYIKDDGTTEIISSSASTIYKGTTTLTDITPLGYTVSDGRFDSATMNNIHYLFREGEDPLYYDGTTCDLISNHANYSGTVPKADIVQAGLGRLWVARTDTDLTTVYWSDLLIGAAWDTGSSGSIDFSKVWPDGEDEIVAIAIHNGLLVVFGSRQILVYTGAIDPATMELTDTIVGIGCVSRDTVQRAGTDLIFLSESGVRSLKRTIQEKSVPITDISKNVRTEITEYILTDNGQSFSAYSPEEAFYVIHFPAVNVTYCFDMRAPLQDGSHRVTRWNNINPLSFCRTRNGDLLLGQSLGVAKYDGYQDNGVSYELAYFTNFIDFQAPSNLKLLKNLKITIIGGSNTDVVLNWGYDYSYAYKKKRFTLATQEVAEFGVAEYNIGEYNVGVLVNRPVVNASGGGQVVQLGVQAEINGSPLSMQRITAQAIVGRIV